MFYFFVVHKISFLILLAFAFWLINLFLTVVLRKIRQSVTGKVWKTEVPIFACVQFIGPIRRAQWSRQYDINFFTMFCSRRIGFITTHSTPVCLFTLTVSCDNLLGSCCRIQQGRTGSYRIMPDCGMLWQLPTVFLAILLLF